MAEVFSFGLAEAGPDGQDLLWEIFRSSRAGPIATLPEDLLRMQHRAREASYAEAYPGVADSLITVSGTPAGRVLVWRTETEHRMVDIAILPTYRDSGLGTLVIRSLIDDALNSNKPLRLTVANDNTAALRLYRRLGFVTTGDDGVSISMEISSRRG